MFDTFIITPMANALLLLYSVLGNNFVLAIAVFTILIRLLTLPLNLRQQRSAVKTQELQPKIREIQQKYRDNPQKMQEEFQKIGYNPAETLTGCLPLLIQMPILIGLYRVLLIALGTTPQALYELTERVYTPVRSMIDLSTLLPVTNKFMWLNLGQPDPLFILPVLVLVTMFVQQKLMTPAKPKQDESNSKKKQKQQPDDPTAAVTQSMQYTMPIMFGVFSMQFQAGLSIYFVLSNLIGIGQGYYILQAKEVAKEEYEKSKANRAMMSSSDSESSTDKPTLEDSLSSNENGLSGQKKKRSSSKRKRRSAKR
jgi:YidC/Oxa1 family membrane protein insertase